MGRNIKAESSNLWMQHMRSGAFEEAWKCSDEDIKARAGKPCWHLPRHLQYIWNGESLENKTVLIRCYHGLGDTIQFIRFAPLVKAIAKEVIVWAQPELIPLLKTTKGIDKLLPLHNGTPEVEYDIDVEIMELAHIFRISEKTILSTVPYLHVEPISLSSNNKFKVGLVWQAGNWDASRNIPFEFFQPLAEIENIQLIILQANAEAAGWKKDFGLNPGDFNLYDYARVIRQLDLLISVDSMPAHLAGALGVPVWTLLQAQADWRWMNDRDDSPWYPAMKLFRQQKQGEWEFVIQNVSAELNRLLRYR